MILRQQSNRQSRRAAAQSFVRFVDDPAPCRGRHPFKAYWWQRTAGVRVQAAAAARAGGNVAHSRETRRALGSAAGTHSTQRRADLADSQADDAASVQASAMLT